MTMLMMPCSSFSYSNTRGVTHTIFGKSTIKQSHIDAMRGRYFHDMSIVRVGGDSTAPTPEENEVVIYRSFLKAGLRFPLSKFVVEVLEKSSGGEKVRFCKFKSK